MCVAVLPIALRLNPGPHSSTSMYRVGGSGCLRCPPALRLGSAQAGGLHRSPRSTWLVCLRASPRQSQATPRRRRRPRPLLPGLSRVERSSVEGSQALHTQPLPHLRHETRRGIRATHLPGSAPADGRVSCGLKSPSGGALAARLLTEGRTGICLMKISFRWNQQPSRTVGGEVA